MFYYICCDESNVGNWVIFLPPNSYLQYRIWMATIFIFFLKMQKWQPPEETLVTHMEFSCHLLSFLYYRLRKMFFYNVNKLIYNQMKSIFYSFPSPTYSAKYLKNKFRKYSKNMYVSLILPLIRIILGYFSNHSIFFLSY